MIRIHAPELPQSPWLNSPPLSLASLRGQIVLLDFWSYCCINCLHVLPDLKYLEQKYGDHLTVIGVHSAKFDNEKAVENVRQASQRYGVAHPVLVDSDLQVWQQYAIKAWPTFVLIDPQGYIVAQMTGEGKRQALDQEIARLISDFKPQAKPFLLPEPPALNSGLLAFPGKVLADASSKRLFIADTGHDRIVIASLDGKVEQIVGGPAGLWDGGFEEAEFASPQGMAFDSERQWLYVADTDNHAIRKLDLNQQTVETIAGVGHQSQILHPHSGDASTTALNSPWDLLLFRHFLLVAMAGSHQIWGLDLHSGQIGTFVGTGAEGCWDGDAAVAAFAQPSGLATDGRELYVADSESSTIRAVELDNDPVVRVVCGSGDLFGFGDQDGAGEAVRLQHCMGLAYDPGHSSSHSSGHSSGRSSGHSLDHSLGQQLWIADTYNHKIKRVDLQTGLCETLLGDGVPGRRDGRGKAARFYEPSGLSLAASWLYIADTNNHAIRRVDLTSLDVTTLVLEPADASGKACRPEGCD